jgi:cell division protease FtsH
MSPVPQRSAVAAEEITFEDGGGNGVGGSDRSDLASATRIAAAMVGSYGLSGPHPLVDVDNHFATGRLIEHRYMRMAVQTELSNALREAKRLLLLPRTALEEVSGKLLLDRRISGYEVDRIMKRHAASDRQRADRGEAESGPVWSL